MTDLIPVLMLSVSFALFLLSMRPWRTRVRLIVWSAATVLVAASAFSNSGSTNSMGLLSSLLHHPQVVVAAFQGNWPTTQEFVQPAIDLLIMFGVLLAAGCLLALTPGDGVERFVRPINIGMMGAVVGGALVLLISSVGFGSVAKRQVFMATLGPEDIVDGDTIRMGDVSLRIWGIDAPEDDQICLKANRTPFDCGSIAMRELANLALPGPVYCGPPKGNETKVRLQESFGRPLVSCESDQPGHGELPDIGREMVRMGYAYPYENRDGAMVSVYAAERDAAIQQKAGFHNGVFLKPTQWRNDPHARCHIISMSRDVPESEPNRDRLVARLKRLREACRLSH